MRKLLLAILILLFSANAYAGNCVASKAGNWSDVTVWGTSCNGSTNAVPVANDNVDLAGYVIVWDVATVAVIPATGSLGTLTSSANSVGQITVDISDAACHGNEACKITATSITGGYKPSTNYGIIYISGTVSGTPSDHCLGIHANITGGGNTDAMGIYHGSNGKVRVTGTVTGGSGTTANGFKNLITGTFEILGNVTGGSGTLANGLYNTSSGTGTITGDVSAGSGQSAAGLYLYSTGLVTVTGNFIANQTGPGWMGRAPAWNPGNTYYYQMYVDGTDKKFYIDTDPGEANVKSGTTYYYNSGTVKTGTYTSGGGGAYAY